MWPRRCVRRMPARVIEVGERAFDPLAALTHQAPAAASRESGDDCAYTGAWASGAFDQVAAPAIRLRDVGPDADGLEIDHRLITVIPLVGDDLFQRLRRPSTPTCAASTCSAAANRRLDDRRRIALVGALQRDRDDGARLQVDRMLGLVGQMRAAIFHLRDLRIGIVGIRPVLVRGLLLALPVQPRQVVARRRLDARRLREPRQKRPDSFRRCRAARCCASPRSLRGWSHRSPIVLPLSNPASTSRCCTHVKTSRCVSTVDQAPRARQSSSDPAGLRPTASRRNPRTANESVARQAIPRSESMPSK